MAARLGPSDSVGAPGLRRDLERLFQRVGQRPVLSRDFGRALRLGAPWRSGGEQGDDEYWRSRASISRSEIERRLSLPELLFRQFHIRLDLCVVLLARKHVRQAQPPGLDPRGVLEECNQQAELGSESLRFAAPYAEGLRYPAAVKPRGASASPPCAWCDNWPAP